MLNALARQILRRPGVYFLALLIALAAPARAALPAGDIVVTANISTGDTGLVLIDPATGNRSILSDNAHGTGMPFSQPLGVSVTANGDLLVTDMGFPSGPMPVSVDGLTPPPPPPTPARVYLVDPSTGNRTVLSQDSMTDTIPPYAAIGSGTMFNGPVIARQVGNQILMTDSSVGAGSSLMTIDPSTGNRAVISGRLLPGGLQVSGSTAFVADEFEGLLSVDLATGNRTIISGKSAGSGPAFNTAADVATYGGQLLVSGGNTTDFSTFGIYRIDPTTGNRTMVSTSTVGTGPIDPGGTLLLAVEPGGTILASTLNSSLGLLAVDPTTGNRTILSDATHGAGPTFTSLNDVAVVPLPGDANGDGMVNGLDINAVAAQWNHTGYFLMGDTNGDGMVNGLDINAVALHWQQHDIGVGRGGIGGGGLGGGAGEISAVPEPSTSIMAAFGGLALLLWRRAR
jgi:hypothetical protein